MIKKPITIHLSTGLEARPVAQLVQVASQFNSEIYVEVGKKKVNAKSIMGMMTLGLDDMHHTLCDCISGTSVLRSDYRNPGRLHSQVKPGNGICYICNSG